MSKRPVLLWCSSFALLLAGFKAPEICAQYAPAPDAYAVTEVNSMFGPAVNMQIQRDGSKVMVHSSHAALPGGQPSHLRTLYDLDAHRSFTWDLLNSAVPCGADGQLRIENVLSAFQLELTFGKAGDASALIYRQCFAPQTTPRCRSWSRIRTSCLTGVIGCGRSRANSLNLES